MKLHIRTSFSIISPVIVQFNETIENFLLIGAHYFSTSSTAVELSESEESM